VAGRVGQQAGACHVGLGDSEFDAIDLAYRV